ncbi:MAG: spore coat protein U domain-containing protein [Nitrosomonadales bacterium]|nr:spore coat protein U domain-containing protein [Nitrosomonadales bacterium]
MQMKTPPRMLLACALLTGTLTAQAAAVCTVQTTPLSFGSYLGNALTSTATITTTCDLPAVVTVEMDKGGGASLSSRVMSSAASQMSYNLYTDATHQVIWGDGTSGTQTVTGTNLTVYGLIPANQTVAAGNYGDTVVVTISY